VTDEPRVPNNILRRIREEERQESRSEFAEALARKARELGEPVMPSERYVARLEDGDVKYPSAPYRRLLTELCQRSITDLGFIPRYRSKDKEISGREILVYASLKVPPRDTDIIAASEWPAWFGIRLAHLVALVENWHGSAEDIYFLQDLPHQEIVMFDAIAPDEQQPIDVVHALSRRQALITLAALPVTLTAGRVPGAGVGSAGGTTEFFLSRCAASLTACWHLLRGTDIRAIDQIISGYLVELDGIAQQQSKYQHAAARLASQAHRICGIVALHRNQLKAREVHCHRALNYARMAADITGQASAIISLASTYFYSSDPARAAVTYEQAFTLDSGMSRLQESRVHAELSVVYGQLQREQDAIRSIAMAEELYPDQAEHDPSFLYAEFTPGSLALEEGLAYVALAEQFPERGYQHKAAETFGRLDHMRSGIPERIRFEIINHQATTSVLLNDIEAFGFFMNRAFDGATLLASVQRRKEINLAWRKAITRWPREPRIKALAAGVRLIDGTALQELPDAE